MPKPKLYLSGSFHSGWQDRVIERLSERFQILDPRTLQRRSLEAVASIERNWLLYDACFVLAYLEKDNPCSLGLFAELAAFPHKHRIYLADEWQDRKSRWLCEFAQVENVYHTLDAAVEALMQSEQRD